MGTKRKIKQKKWNDKRSIKLRNKWYGKERRIKRFLSSGINNKDDLGYNNPNLYRAELPENFSLVDNTQDTIDYFNKIVKVIEKRHFRQQFYIDASKVKEVTTEALIYIIAIVYNIKANRSLQYSFEGNLPVDQNARAVFSKSGYLNYFKMKRLRMPDSSEYVQIVSGNRVETGVARQICDFVSEKLGSDRTQTKILYATLIELMSNTAKHAYQKQDKLMVECWYLYATYEDDKVMFSFVDTGSGIPNTIKKKLIERINPTLRDSEFIEMAFLESGRSETGLPNRGRGLPQLYQHVVDNEIDEFFVLSGAGSCAYNKHMMKLDILDYSHRINGTIFSFSIRKGKEKCIS